MLPYRRMMLRHYLSENRHYIITAEDVLVDILDDGVNLFDNVEKETENYYAML